MLSVSQILFFWMAVDRTNISGVLTSTFLKDTGITRDQANTGTSLLWFGIVLLEIPSNVSNSLCVRISFPGLTLVIGYPAQGRATLVDPITSRGLGHRRVPASLRH